MGRRREERGGEERAEEEMCERRKERGGGERAEEEMCNLLLEGAFRALSAVYSSHSVPAMCVMVNQVSHSSALVNLSLIGCLSFSLAPSFALCLSLYLYLCASVPLCTYVCEHVYNSVCVCICVRVSASIQPISIYIFVC